MRIKAEEADESKLHVLIRRIKRSFRNDREQWIKGGILAAILLVIVIFAGSCACGKKTVKEPDAASQGVMKITPIPSPTPTVAPRQVNKDAVAQSGSVTMVNEYLVQKEEQSASGTSTSDQQEASSESAADGGEDTSSQDTSADTVEDSSENE